MRRRWMQSVVLILVLGGMVLASRLDARVEQEQSENTAPLTLTWFVAESDYEKNWNPKTNLGDAKLLEQTGVQLEITSGDLSDLDALIATDALPDLITMDAGASQRLLLENSGMVLPLDSLFADYAPDVNIPESMKDWYRNSDGNWYAIASYYYGPERVNESFGGYIGTHNNNYVRLDLLNQIGMNIEDLATKDGLLEALHKASHLKYKGQDIIPCAGWWTQNFAEQFGMSWEEADGSLTCRYEQPEWLEALLFGNQLYREGLLKAEDFTESLNQRRLQVEAGKAFFVNGYSNVKDAKDALYSSDNNAMMENAKFVYGDAHKEPQLKSISTGGWTATMISAKTENGERIAQFISYMTQEEATLDAAPGVGTETYTIENGIYQIKPSVQEEFQDNYVAAAAKYYLNLEFFVDWTIVQKYQDSAQQADYQSIKSNEISIYDSKAYDAAITMDSSSDMGQLSDKIEAYYDTAEIRILTAESEAQCQKYYEEALQTMRDMGLEELMQYENEQYQLEKQKLGTD